MNFEVARTIADAVLMEGYALYPYRASAPKNRFRWTFGVLAPRSWSSAGGCEAWWLEAQLLVAGAPRRIAGRLRFFQVERNHGTPPWDEGVLRTFDFDIHDGHTCVPFGCEGDARWSATNGRERHALVGNIVIRRERISAAQPLTKLTIRIENQTPWADNEAAREQVMLASLASAHLLVGVEGGALLSATEPPSWASAAAASCTNTRTYPVLVGGSELVLAAPFIMQDQPQIAPESAGDMCDAGEIDELLVLRTRTMTDDEKREARATDPRAAAIVDRADALASEQLARMHGATRDVSNGEMIAQRPAIGSKVRLLAPTTRTDAQDLLYAGHVATVVEIREDVDGTSFFGVTIDADPAAELHRWYGRCHYYRLDEIEVL